MKFHSIDNYWACIRSCYQLKTQKLLKITPAQMLMNKRAFCSVSAQMIGPPKEWPLLVNGAELLSKILCLYFSKKNEKILRFMNMHVVNIWADTPVIRWFPNSLTHSSSYPSFRVTSWRTNRKQYECVVNTSVSASKPVDFYPNAYVIVKHRWVEISQK